MAALTIPFQYADNLPLVPEEEVFAHIIDIETGGHYDDAYNFETAINDIQSGGLVAVAVRDWLWFDGTVRATPEEVLAVFDRERRLFEDCFNAEVRVA